MIQWKRTVLQLVQITSTQDHSQSVLQLSSLTSPVAVHPCQQHHRNSDY